MNPVRFSVVEAETEHSCLSFWLFAVGWRTFELLREEEYVESETCECPQVLSSCPRVPASCPSAVNGPVDEVEEDVGAGEDHPGVFVDGVRVLDDVEASQALPLLGGGGLAAHGQVHHHVLRLLRDLVLLLQLVLGNHGLLGVSGQAVGVGLAVRPVQHGHGPGLRDAAGAGQRLTGTGSTRW